MTTVCLSLQDVLCTHLDFHYIHFWSSYVHGDLKEGLSLWSQGRNWPREGWNSGSFFGAILAIIFASLNFACEGEVINNLENVKMTGIHDLLAYVMNQEFAYWMITAVWGRMGQWLNKNNLMLLLLSLSMNWVPGTHSWSFRDSFTKWINALNSKLYHIIKLLPMIIELHVCDPDPLRYRYILKNN